MHINIKPYDEEFYSKNLMDFLPYRFIDVHTHIWLEKFKIKETTDRRGVSWPSKVASGNSIEDLFYINKTLFPGKAIIPVVFGQPELLFDIDKCNEYVKDCSEKYNLPALMLVKPDMAASEFERKIKNSKFKGIKVYFEYSPSYIPTAEIRIFDFLTHEHLEIINANKMIVMLHIPRSRRLRDEVNLAQMIEIDKKYKDSKVIIAHAGRAYSDSDLGGSMAAIKKTENLLFDISANTNSYVFKELICAAGAGRIMYGSDLPIFAMRGKRETAGSVYVNVVPKHLYGDISGDKNMREADEDEEKTITFMLYEEILALKKACSDIKLKETEKNNILYGNASCLFDIQ